MTLTTQTQRWEYVGDGATTIFAYDARVDIASDMKAFLNGLPTDISFTVTGLGNDNGGNVIFNSPPALDVAISLERILPFQQTTDFPVRGPFPAEANEGTFDRIVMMLQQTRTNLIDIQDYLGIGVGGGGEIFPIGGQVPPGLIAEWAGAVTDIPNGWFLCDGTNNTPDLKGRFIASLDEGAAPGEFGNIGEIGGENDVTLTLNEMPNHKHNVSPVGVNGLVTPPPGGSTTTGGSESRADVLVEGVTGHTQLDGVALPHNNVPLYYTLAYIQYQGGSLPPSFIGSIPNTTFFNNEVITPIDVSGQFFVGDGTNPVYTASGLPPGLSIDPVSGIISGTVDTNASALSPYMVTVQLATSINPPATSFPVATWTVTAFPDIGVGSIVFLDPTGITKSGGNVTGWDADVLGSYGGDATLSNLSNVMPEDTVSGFDVVKSANTSPRYQVADVPFVTPSGFTLFLVGGFDAHTNDPASLIIGDPADDVQFENAAGVLRIRGSAIGVLSSMAEDTAGHVWAVRCDSGNYRSRISGDVANWVTNATIIDQGFNYINILNDTNDLNTQAVGWVGNFFIYPTMSDAHMDDLYAKLLAKWGL